MYVGSVAVGSSVCENIADKKESHARPLIWSLVCKQAIVAVCVYVAGGFPWQYRSSVGCLWY